MRWLGTVQILKLQVLYLCRCWACEWEGRSSAVPTREDAQAVGSGGPWDWPVSLSFGCFINTEQAVYEVKGGVAAAPDAPGPSDRSLSP